MTHSKVEKIYKQLGKLITARRLELGVTHSELSKKIKMSRPALINMEAGRQRIMLHRVVDLDKALGYPKGYLLLKLLRGEG
jgi:transcriptional regulator with XRE-family HTH domain